MRLKEKNTVISILMPVFNAMPYLRECLDSILRQSETNWELIAVDDFSTDSSLQTLRQYAAQDVRIKVLVNKEKGIIPALRLAYQHSTGLYLTRMDADDKMSVHKLAKLQSALQQSGAGSIATAQVKYFSENTLGDGYRRYEQWLNELSEKEENFLDIYRECVIPSPCWMVARADFEKCGAFEPDTYPEDYDLCFRFYENKLQLITCKEVLHYWRDYPDRTSRNDETYANNKYFALKLPYFLKLDFDKNRPLVLWGAGKKGKTIARMLEAAGITFHWICNTPSKWGVKLYSTRMQAVEHLKSLDEPQIIIAVAAPAGRSEIEVILKKRKSQLGKDYFFFC